MTANMSIYILGISAFYHDSAACLLKDGEIIAGSSEERFSRIKNDNSFPIQSINFCLEYGGISITDVAYVAYYEKPILKFDRILNTFISGAPKGFLPFKMAVRSWLSSKLWVSSIINTKLGYKGEIKFCKHHESHAASSYYTSPFLKSAFLTIDGVGETATTSFGVANDCEINTLKEIHFPHSLGLLYSSFTYYCGFKVNSGEYKLMGLAPYGVPRFVSLIKEKLIKLESDGSFELNMKYFTFGTSFKMINNHFIELFDAPPRKESDLLSQHYKDVAASIQKVTEEAVINLVTKVKRDTGYENLCLAGGVALNCVANRVIEKAAVFKNIWVQPASGDSGNSIGAALLVWHKYLENPKLMGVDSPAVTSYLGPSFTNIQIEKVLVKNGLHFAFFEKKAISKKIAKFLQNKMVIGWFNGKMEFGPRALGNRSILASPQFADMQFVLNHKIKKREGFRPFAPVVIEELAKDWFDVPKSSKSMLFTYNCLRKDEIPACVHLDGSSRVQTVAENDNPNLYGLLEEFNKVSGIPILINTSMNVRGEPMVNSPQDAINCFFNTDMDVLVLNQYVLIKSEQKEELKSGLNVQYELD
jgi:carbamoyltransferase